MEFVIYENQEIYDAEINALNEKISSIKEEMKSLESKIEQEKKDAAERLVPSWYKGPFFAIIKYDEHEHSRYNGGFMVMANARTIKMSSSVLYIDGFEIVEGLDGYKVMPRMFVPRKDPETKKFMPSDNRAKIIPALIDIKEIHFVDENDGANYGNVLF